MEVCPYSYFWRHGYFRGPWVSFFAAIEFSVRVTKITSRIGVSELTVYLSVFDLFITQWIMAILSKGCEPDNFESQIFWNLTLQMFEVFVRILLNVNLSLNQTSPDILALFETNLDDSIDSGSFSLTVYLSLIRRDSDTHMHGLAVYVKEGLSFKWDLSLENYLCRVVLMFLTGFTSLSIWPLFPSMIKLFVFMHVFWFYFI